MNGKNTVEERSPSMMLAYSLTALFAAACMVASLLPESSSSDMASIHTNEQPAANVALSR